MSRKPARASLKAVRRLSVTKQHLAGKLPSHSTRKTILSVVRDVAYIQWDPVPIVAPSHILSLWNRVGGFRASDLDRLLWREKRLFQHWTPMASIVLSEDYPLYNSLMSRYPESLSKSWGSQRVRAKQFLAAHKDLRRRILSEVRNGPLRVGEFGDHSVSKRNDGEWSPSSDVSQMLYHLTMSGDMMVVGHRGNQNLWGLSGQFLPDWVERKALTAEDAEREAAQRAIRALGTASPREITFYFVRGRYDHLRDTLAHLEKESMIHQVRVDELGARDTRYIHSSDLALLEKLEGDSGWEPRVTLLPPFDNLVINSARTSHVFGFDYVREQFLPKEKRRFGTYVLPILWGEKFVGRIDPQMDREKGELVIKAVHAEPGAPSDRTTITEIAETIRRLGSFLGADRVRYAGRLPASWRSALLRAG
ncbi:MAG: crosslink repair DNA glycosylase YcaQ family protein [Thermoplasmata archaeon]